MRLEWTSGVFCARFLLKAMSSLRLDQCRVLSGQSSKTPKDGDCSISLSNLFHYLAVLTETVFSYIWSESLLSVCLFSVVLLLFSAPFSAELHHSLNYIIISYIYHYISLFFSCFESHGVPVEPFLQSLLYGCPTLEDID